MAIQWRLHVISYTVYNSQSCMFARKQWQTYAASQ